MHSLKEQLRNESTAAIHSLNARFAMLVLLQFHVEVTTFYVMITVIVSIHVAFYTNCTRDFTLLLLLYVG